MLLMTTGPNRGRSNKEHNTVDLISYWQRFVAPFLRARFGRTERGASLVEYALLVALIAVVCILAITFVGTKASAKFSSVGSSLT
jgi:pilus assembly protein Flp/PilA